LRVGRRLQQLRYAANMVVVMMRNQNMRQTQTVLPQRGLHGRGIARIDHQRILAIVQKPDIVIRKNGQSHKFHRHHPLPAIIRMSYPATQPATPAAATAPISWHTSAAGQYVLGWQAERYAQATAGVFGYYALQLACPALPTLAASRIAHRWLGLQHEDCAFAAPQLRLDYHQLPLQEASVDLLALPHTLEASADPQATLRDAARALVPQGRLLISGFNPRGLWFSPTAALRRRHHGLPDPSQLISLRLLRQYLAHCGLQLESLEHGCWQSLHTGSAPYAPAPRTETWGARLLPAWGNSYFVQARKQVLGATLLQAHWQKRWPLLPGQTTALGSPPAQKPSQPSPLEATEPI
jgi:SAM-dependent methyltransferase